MWLNFIMIYLSRSFRSFALTFKFTAPFPWPTFHCTLKQLDREVTTAFEQINRAAAVSVRAGCIISLGPFPSWLQLGIAQPKPPPFHLIRSPLLKLSIFPSCGSATWQRIWSSQPHSILSFYQNTRKTRVCRGRGRDDNEKLRRVSVAWHVEFTTRDTSPASGNYIKTRSRCQSPETPTSAVHASCSLLEPAS